MPLTYPQINKCLLAYFLESKTFCDQVVLTLDSREMENLFQEGTFPAVLQCILAFWEHAAYQKEFKSELGFGIIAIQSMVAYEHTLTGHTAIREQLETILKIDPSLLDFLFRGSYPEEKALYTFQDRLWYGVKDYLRAVYKLQLNLPAPRKRFAWRFVHYPASQVLFSSEELQCFTRIFWRAALSPGMQITLEDFREKVFNRWKVYRVDIPNRVEKLLINYQDKPEAEFFCRQLYQYFNDWDGTVYKCRFGQVSRSETNHQHRRLVAEYIEDNYEFSEYDPASDEYLPIDTEAYFNNFPARRQFGLLTLDTGYTNIYSEQKSVVPAGCPLLFIFRLDQSNDAHRYFKYQTIISEREDCRQLTKDVYLCRFEDAQELRGFVDLNIQEATAFPVRLQYGLKLGYRTYLQTCGPKIEIADPSISITLTKLGSRPIDLKAYDPEQATPGKYVIIIPGHPQLSFHIVPPASISLPEPAGQGLAYRNWSLQSDDYDIAGSFIQAKARVPGQNPVREWIKIQTQLNYHSPSDATIIKVLNRSKYGERKSSGHSH